MWERFAPRLRKVVAASLEEAGRAGRDEAAPQDLLAAMAREPECAAVFMFEHAGVGAARLLDEIGRVDEHGAVKVQRASRFAARTLHVLDVAAGEADRVRDRHVGTEHVALALTRVNNNLATEIL